MTFSQNRRRLMRIVCPLLGLGLVACGAAPAGEDSSDKSGSAPLSTTGGWGEGIEELYEDGPILREGGSEVEAEIGLGGASPGEAADPDECLRLISLGAVGKYGAVPGEAGRDALAAWLNESSNANALHIDTQEQLSPELLESADVVLLRNLEGWEFSREEIETFEGWVRAGGGVMALAGYSVDGMDEVVPTNKLVSFSGLNYKGFSDADTSTSLSACGYCLGTTHKQGGFNPEHPIAQGVEYVGAFQGRSVHGSGQIVAEEDGVVYGMTEQVDDGRVFLFHDDWVSYVSEWSLPMVPGCEENLECSSVAPSDTYQVAQFWYNSLRWLAPQADCFELNSDAL